LVWILSKLQHDIDKLNTTINARKRAKDELEQRYGDIKKIHYQREIELDEANRRAKNILARIGANKDQLKTDKVIKEKERDVINARISEIDKALNELPKKALTEAYLIATTLTKTFSSKEFPDKPFDVLIIDESSMAPLPYVFWAASKALTFITIVGNFKQLPPICVSDDGVSKKWLGRSIFEIIGINSVKDAFNDKRISLLDTQYRMAPKIADILNTLFYEDKLKNSPSTEKLILEDDLSGQNHLIFVNTSSLNPWCSQLSAGGRFNIYNALVSAALAFKLLPHLDIDEKIGIISPYRAQARLIDKIAKDWSIQDRIRVDTVHRFQGGEEKIIILDCVEGPGAKCWSMLDDQRPDSEAQLLLNVALTRAKCKMILVGHKDYLFSSLNKNSILTRIIDLICSNGVEISSKMLVDSYLATDFDK